MATDTAAKNPGSQNGSAGSLDDPVRELVLESIKEFGGARQLARAYRVEFLTAKPGSNQRLHILKMIRDLIKVQYDHQPAARDLPQMTPDELTGELEVMLGLEPDGTQVEEDAQLTPGEAADESFEMEQIFSPPIELELPPNSDCRHVHVHKKPGRDGKVRHKCGDCGLELTNLHG